MCSARLVRLTDLATVTKGRGLANDQLIFCLMEAELPDMQSN